MFSPNQLAYLASLSQAFPLFDYKCLMKGSNEKDDKWGVLQKVFGRAKSREVVQDFFSFDE